MKIVIAGGSGFVGRELTTLLLEEGHELIILTRGASKRVRNISYVQWLQAGVAPEKAIQSADVFINLAGISINAGRWNHEHQQQIYDSRMTATEELLRIIATLETKPSVLINASAIGIYPVSDDIVYTEDSMDLASDFLAKTVADWEKKAAQAEKDSVRTVFMRFGVILGKDAGALPPMILPYKLFAGGTVGTGRQWISWVHIQDVARAVSFAIQNENIQGPVNVTAPFPKRMAYFGKTIGAILHRPHWLPVPSLMMKIALGKKSALVLEGQHVVPQKLLDNGFEFQYPTLEAALKNLL
ncbi:TIGR01777 family oxidoreductase [Sporosarcina sp. ACRSM]|uniref:TIGR01777 family oxidoreductase n=1 Tax=Sporosarcina sp. ACRSM TaxID=2918216 RepID=UPI001EF68087|nr:TIGR01777 family oxidoreductase [Sporosarcina sp. ACRSM]MCG7336814.1 TIGR01777 family oxidoreductase [Sporosarcina sp. ACRSM]